jgi:anti-anti-sigma factor
LPVSVEEKRQGDCARLELRGDFRGGGDSYSDLRAAGHRALADCRLLVLDLAHVAFLDSQTLGLLVELMRLARSRGGELYLANASDRVSRWFELSGLDRIFRFLEEGAAPALPQTRRGSGAGRDASLDSVDIEVMVSELSEALGAPDPDGAPARPVPGEEVVISEIRKLLDARDGEPG